jgi:hypothetical protein
MGANTATVQKLYVAFFNRPGDALGQAFWEGKMDAGMTEAQVAASFAQSTEYTSVYGSLTTAQTVSTLYTNLFGRSAAAGEITFWGLRLLNGQETVASIARTLANSAQGTDATAIANKISAATSFTNGLTTTDQIVGYSGTAANNVAKAWLATVTSDAATLTAATASLTTTITSATTAGNNAAGSTFTLTTGVDNFTGTSGNDTFIADNTGATKQLSAADQINGGSGTDTLKIYLATGDTATGQPSLSGIEAVYINGGAITAYTAATGTTSLSIDSPVVNTAATYTLAGQSITLANHKVTANTTTTIASTSDTSETITLNGETATTGNVNTIDLSGTKVTSATITATGSASTVTLTDTGAALTSLSIAGEANLTLTEALNGLKTINASAATGKVAVDASGATLDAAFAFTGGSGNDTLTLKAGALGLITAGSQLDGGAGTDTLVTNETAALTAAQVTKINAVKNFEVLAFGTTGSGVDISGLTSINQFKVAAGNFSETFTNGTSASKFTVDNSAGNSGTVSISNKVGETSTSVTLDTGTATAAKTLATLTLTGITNVALTSTGAAGNVVTTLNNADNSAITVTGSADLTLGLKATSIGSKIDGSAATGKLTLTGNTTAYSAGSSLGDTLIGGSGNDTIKASVNNATLTGNGGSDTFDVSVAKGGTASLTTITDFTKGDKITLAAGNGTAAFTATKVDVSAASTVAAALDLASASDGSTNSAIKWFQFGGNTYLVEDNTAASTFSATDVAVKLVGTLDLSTSTLATVTVTFA